MVKELREIRKQATVINVTERQINHVDLFLQDRTLLNEVYDVISIL